MKVIYRREKYDVCLKDACSIWLLQIKQLGEVYCNSFIKHIRITTNNAEEVHNFLCFCCPKQIFTKRLKKFQICQSIIRNSF